MSKTITYDVFITHRAKDELIARRLAKLLEKSGLSVYSQLTSKAAARFADEMREALSESRSLVVIMSEVATASTTIALEVGAAHAWQKAIFVVLHDISHAQVPAYLSGTPFVRSNQIEKLVDAIKATSNGLTDKEKILLSDLYRRTGVPTDRLLHSPVPLERLARDFNRLAQTSLAPETILQELIRLRKKGKLGTTRRRPKGGE
ncbi:MAG: toll/interleukin-1 receptor domain-containing protein [Tepidisphaeraceae bacterium]